MKKILIATTAMVLVGTTSVFAGGVSEASVQPSDCARDVNNECIVIVGPASSLLGGLGGGGVAAGIAALLVVGVLVSSASSTNGTN